MLSANSCAYESGDFQIWNKNDEYIGIGKDTNFTMEEEFRYGENATEFFYQHYEFGFVWAFDKRLELASGYRLALQRYKHKWLEEDEPFASITPKIDIWNFKFDNRNRLEYRHFRWASDHVRYRNRSTLKYPIPFHTIKIAPYVSDEIFISSNGTGFNQNRFWSGLEFELTKYVRSEVAYMLWTAKSQGNKWYTANVLWLKLKIAF